MKKIVRGNDCTLRIPVKKMVDGELVAFALPACTDIVVNLVSSLRRYALTFEVDAAEDHVINAHVKGGTMPLSPLALEVKGKLFGCDWRSNEYEQIQFVDNNASGDTEFDGSEDEGEQSVEMDTAIVVLAPTADLTLLIKQAEEELAKCTASEELRVKNEEERKASEELRCEAETGRTYAEAARVSAEQTREAREAERQTADSLRTANETERKASEELRVKSEESRQDAEALRTKTELEREANELTRKANEQSRKASEEGRVKSEESRQANETDRQLAEQGRKESEERRVKNEESRTQAETLRSDNESSRQLAETRRADNETRRQAAETQREKDMKAAVDEAIARAKVSVDYLPESGEIQITTWGS